MVFPDDVFDVARECAPAVDGKAVALLGGELARVARTAARAAHEVPAAPCAAGRKDGIREGRAVLADCANPQVCVDEGVSPLPVRHPREREVELPQVLGRFLVADRNAREGAVQIHEVETAGIVDKDVAQVQVLMDEAGFVHPCDEVGDVVYEGIVERFRFVAQYLHEWLCRRDEDGCEIRAPAVPAEADEFGHGQAGGGGGNDIRIFPVRLRGAQHEAQPRYEAVPLVLLDVRARPCVHGDHGDGAEFPVADQVRLPAEKRIRV